MYSLSCCHASSGPKLTRAAGDFGYVFDYSKLLYEAGRPAPPWLGSVLPQALAAVAKAAAVAHHTQQQTQRQPSRRSTSGRDDQIGPRARLVWRGGLEFQ